MATHFKMALQNLLSNHYIDLFNNATYPFLVHSLGLFTTGEHISFGINLANGGLDNHFRYNSQHISKFFYMLNSQMHY